MVSFPLDNNIARIRFGIVESDFLETCTPN